MSCAKLTRTGMKVARAVVDTVPAIAVLEDENAGS